MKPPPLPPQPSVPAPPGMVWLGDVKVAGTQFEGREDLIRMITRPDSGGWILFSRPEPQNPHDANAIAIIASSGKREIHLGYLPRQVAASLRGYKHIGIYPRSVAGDGRYLYVDVFHSAKKSGGCLGCLPVMTICGLAIGAGLHHFC